MLSKIFGDGPQVKLINYLLAHPEEEFSKTQLAEGAEITRPTLYKLLDKLIKYELMVEKKKIGNIQLYQLNTQSELIKPVCALHQTVHDIDLDKDSLNPNNLNSKSLDSSKIDDGDDSKKDDSASNTKPLSDAKKTLDSYF